MILSLLLGTYTDFLRSKYFHRILRVASNLISAGFVFLVLVLALGFEIFRQLYRQAEGKAFSLGIDRDAPSLQTLLSYIIACRYL